ncbi:MAG: hypothetical protein JWQ09_1796 [Segetibacter sp.]|nr:hypothetical protein [Segetibacter sp.]
METKLIMKSGISKPIAQNISPANLNDLRQTIHCEISKANVLINVPALITDCYPHLTIEQITETKHKPLDWFFDRIRKSIYIVHLSQQKGLIKIEGPKHAKDLFNLQQSGYKALDLKERLEKVLGTDWLNNADEEPEEGKFYLHKFHINGILQETNILIYQGRTNNEEWYVFGYKNDPEQTHLLKAAGSAFPFFHSEISPGIFVFEHYTYYK